MSRPQRTRPEPKFSGGVWSVDLRWAGFGRYDLDGAKDEATALHLAYAKLMELRDQAGALAAQTSFAFTAGPLLREAIRLHWAGREREKMSPDVRRYVRGYLDQLDRRLGGVKVQAFAPPHGDQLLIDWRNDLVDERLKPRTRRNYLNHLMQVLTFSRKRGWLPDLPSKPKPTVGTEVLNDPEWEWYTEDEFRRLRAGIYDQHDEPGDLCIHIKDRDARLDLIARRRLYLSAAFYTGMHTRDLDQLTDRSVSVAFRWFERVNSKSARCIDDRNIDAPEQLIEDAAVEQERLGRYWTPGEAIAGGPWPQVTRVLQSTAKRLGLPRVNLRILRRSTAYHLCLLGWPEDEVAEYLGHVDRRMLNEVYRRLPKQKRSPKRLDWTNENMKQAFGGLTARARVLSFTKPIESERRPPHAAAPPWRGRKKGTNDAG